MRLNAKNSLLRSSARTLKRQPMVNSTSKPEVIDHISHPDMNGLIYGKLMCRFIALISLEWIVQIVQTWFWQWQLGTMILLPVSNKFANSRHKFSNKSSCSSNNRRWSSKNSQLMGVYIGLVETTTHIQIAIPSNFLAPFGPWSPTTFKGLQQGQTLRFAVVPQLHEDWPETSWRCQLNKNQWNGRT